MKHGALLAHNGAFAWINNKCTSQYQGMFFPVNEELFRVVSHLSCFEHANSFAFCGDHIKIALPQGIAKVWFDDKSTFRIVFPTATTTHIDLDCKHIYDNDEWGRNYTINKEGEHPIVTFSKEKGATLYIGFQALHPQWELQEEWKPYQYTYDELREHRAVTRWVYRMGKVRTRMLTIHVAVTYIEAAEFVRRTKSIFVPNHSPTELKKSALLRLKKNANSVAAGYPWFFQSWTRDELISWRGFWLTNQKQLCFNMLDKYAQVLEQQPLLPSILPQSERYAMDTLGWFALRVEQALKTQAGKTYFTKEKQERIGKALQRSLRILWRERGKDDLVWNEAEETWMDTQWNDDARTGHCLEIQALTYAAHRLAKKLNGKKEARKNKLAKKIREQFVVNNILVDRLHDATIRPNIVIAYYVAPELFTNEQWKQFFQHILHHLWLPWGGIASINKDHHNYCDTHTGQSNQSYHRGDSWFWINNLFAVCLQRIDATLFKPYINKLKEASSTAMHIGIADYIPEVSSAKELSAQGCLAQTWSLATYLELIDEVTEEKVIQQEKLESFGVE